MRNDTSLNAALNLVTETGWSVFPVWVGHDTARCDGGTTSCKIVKPLSRWRSDPDGSSSDEGQLRRLWSSAWRDPNAYGIDAGKSGLLVVDVDPGGDYDHPTTRVHTTGRGRHYFFTDMIGLGQHTDWDHVDIRGVGGMVLGPGSWHPHGEYAVERAAEPAALPPEVMAHCRPVTKARAIAPADILPVDTETALAVVRGACRRIEEVGEGGRNAALNTNVYGAARIWTRLPAEARVGELDEDTVKAALLGSVRGVEHGAVKTLDNAWADGLENPDHDRYLPATVDFDVEPGDPGRRPLPESSLEDTALAERISIGGGADSLLAWGRHGWALWDGRRWDTSVSADPVLRIVADALEDIMWSETDRTMADRRRSMQAGGDGKAELKRLNALSKLMSMAKIQTVAAALRTHVHRKLEEFDLAVDHLNVANGVVDLRTGKLSSHDPALMFTKMTPVAYVPGATSADWTKALRALPADVGEWMRLRFGQSAYGWPPLDTVVPFLKGGGENGKSTLLDAVSAALGEFAHMASEKVVLGQNSEHSTETYALKGRRLVYIEELPEGNWVNITRIKKLSGTGKMNARPMREDPVEWTPTHSLMITTNHNTQIGDTDHATWRRLARVEFPYTFSGADRDRSLRLRVQQGTAVEAVLAWVVSGAVDVHRADGEMPIPASVAADTEAWRLGANLPVEFLSECLELKTGAAVPSGLIFRMYRTWAQESNRSSKISDQTFWDRATHHRWFMDGQVAKKVTRAGAAIWPDGQEPKGMANAMLGVQFSEEGERLRERMRIFM